jgi:hypothetical protein
MNLLLAHRASTLSAALSLAIVCACSVNTSGFGPAARVDAGGFDLGAPAGSGGMGAASDAGPRGSGGGFLLASGGQPGSGGAPASGGTPVVTSTGGANPGTGGSVAPGTGGSSSGPGGPRDPGGPEACGPATCPGGCCNGNNCVTANRTNRRCGTGGAACSACDGCFQCVAGLCQVDPQSSWTVTCASATVTPTRAGAVWDPSEPGIRGVLRELGLGDGPLPDPFCQLRIDGTPQSQTSDQLDTLNPSWNESIDPSGSSGRSDSSGKSGRALLASELMSPTTHWTVYVGDDDGSPRMVDDICEVAPLPSDSDFAAGGMTFTTEESCTRLTIQLTCN